MSTTTTAPEVKQVDPTALSSERGLLLLVLVMVLLGVAGIVLMSS
jgi:hypothetical protein